MIRASRIMWFRRLYNDIDAKQKKISWLFLGISKEILFSKLCYKNIVKKPEIQFYDQLLDTWYDFIMIEPENLNEILQEDIFLRNDIKISNKPIQRHFTTYVGIDKITDIVNDNKLLNVHGVI